MIYPLKIVVVVEGGSVQAVCTADDLKIEAIIVDYDNDDNELSNGETASVGAMDAEAISSGFLAELLALV